MRFVLSFSCESTSKAIKLLLDNYTNFEFIKDMSILPKNRFKHNGEKYEQDYDKTHKQISSDVLNSLEYDLIFRMYEIDLKNKICSEVSNLLEFKKKTK